MIYDPFQFFCYYYTEVVKHDPKAPSPGELSAKLTERLYQICDCPMSPMAPSFPSCRKRRGRKGALGYVWCFLRLSLGKPQCFGLAFHSVVTLRASWYAPPDTGASSLQLVAIEYLPSIEGAGRIRWSAPFCGEVCFVCPAPTKGSAPQWLPLIGEGFFAVA